MLLTIIFSTLILVCTAAASPHNGLIPMLDGRIVGGQDTTIQTFPHQVSMRAFYSHRCGGTIVSENIVVSAAHCVDGILFPSYLKIRAGVTYKSDSGVSSWVKKIHVHENYKSSTVDFDISVLILTDSFTFTTSIQSISMASFNEELIPGNKAIVTGWGATQEGGFGSDCLKAVTVTVVGHDECAAAYRNANEITTNMLCAGEETGGSDACQGDSGGPMISMGNDDEMKLFGVVSWGYGCARPEYPGVYAKVSALRQWVDEKMSL